MTNDAGRRQELREALFREARSGSANMEALHLYVPTGVFRVSGTLLPPCNARFEPQDANRLWHIGSHIWSTI
jgi:hypothetical protein